jgi:hypothetical protein
MPYETTILFINEDHSLLPVQKIQMEKEFGRWDTFKISKLGLSIEDFTEITETFFDGGYQDVVILSPAPVLLAKAGYTSAKKNFNIWVFHNDVRIAKEIPDGPNGGVKIIHVVSPNGWKLVKINE